ncbi:hypothetical protein [Amycolatopsis sp. BJA-103]|uniref:hypothetical protein n=1 Tax=Amycolatopsis sp. BJA-103 TaxID=1911175 RepID=UPI000C78B342|nr:hypothetical protein [Amycolatopsis sp. BJA-103]AUI56758.1 hypothetical protein BKN51_00055 [Amycolatopsis sp. BJA-103]AUI56820.1 hypothetical protein BKN51_00385 [Amycolatopsis sp. BJA-103]PNE13463.1 hypothetical protein B1H26_40255 [Amycolatopsis sp. BJA-103]
MTPRIRGCTGKKKYPNATAADDMLGRIWSTCKPGRRLETRAYNCDHCGRWHLTSKPLQHKEMEQAA